MTIFQATFGDGTVLRRTTRSRIYGAAWIAYGKWDGKPWYKAGFSRDQTQAARNAIAETRVYSRNPDRASIEHSEVADAFEVKLAEIHVDAITCEEYRNA